MTIDRDDMISLPSPPPPRPAARRAAIDAALRRFDGIEEEPAERAVRQRPSRIAWSTMHRRPAGALVTAALILIVFIPAVPFILRDSPPGVVPQAEVPGPAQPSRDASICAGADCAGQAAAEPAEARPDGAVVAAATPSPAQALAPADAAAQERSESVSTEVDRKAALEAPAPLLAIAAPPPPPPPPPPAPEADEDSNIVVTGSRISVSDMAKQNRAENVGTAARAASPSTMIDPYGEFLSRLQTSLKANDRRAIIGLIRLPLSVNFDGRTQTYRSAPDVERDFDRIFTPQVRSAALNLRPENLMSRDGGRLKGNGRLMFGCGRTSCSPNAIRIREVNP